MLDNSSFSASTAIGHVFLSRESASHDRITIIWIIKNKSLDPLRAKTTFIRMKDDGPDCTVSDM